MIEFSRDAAFRRAARVAALGAALLMMAGCSGSSNSANSTGDNSGGSAAPSGSAASSSGASSSQSAVQKAPVRPPIVVPDGTVLVVTMDQSVGTKNNQAGDQFDGSLAEPVVVDGKEVIPHGAKVLGHVTVADQAGRVKGGAQLGVALDSVTVNGQKIPVHTSTVSESSKSRGKRTIIGAGGGAAVGAIVGAIAGGGRGAAIGAAAGGGAGTAGAAFTGNRDITIPAETNLEFKLSDSLEIPR